MSNHTNIHWCDSTVNPSTGCDGCELWHVTRKGSCYAGNFHEQRLAKSLPDLYAPDFTEVRMAPGRMIKAAGWSDLTGTDRPDKPWLNGLPRTIFVGDMGDILSGSVTFEYLKSELIDVATSKKGRRHIWMVLTKRPNRLANFADWLLADHGIAWPENIWTGTSVTGQTSLNRIDLLGFVSSAVKFLSVEPLIEGISLDRWLSPEFWDFANPGDRPPFSLVIVGGESGSRARPFDLQWARSLRDQCAAAGVSYFLKQLGAKPYDSRLRISIDGPDSHAVAIDLKDSHGGDWDEWAPSMRVREFPRSAVAHA